MWFKQHKIQALALLIITLMLILLLAASFWNLSKDKADLNGWPLVFLLLSIISVSVFYYVYLKATDPHILENLINEKVAEERTRLLGEMDNKEEVVEEKGIKVDEKAAEIIPKGNFKTAESFAKKLLSNFASGLQMSMGIIYTAKKADTFGFLTGYALPADLIPPDFKPGENLNGQVAATQEITILKDLPEQYFAVESGLGKSKPRNLIIAPFVNNNKTIAIAEIATFIELDTDTELLLKKICSLAAEKWPGSN